MSRRRLTFNLRKDISDERDFKLNFSTLSEGATLPLSIDYTSKMSSVKDQGGLGSCVGFAVAAMKECQERLEHEEEVSLGKKDTRKDANWDLSEQWIYYMSKSIDPWPNEEGTSIRCAMKVLNKIGVPTEKAWPYNDSVIGEPKRWATMVARWSLIKSYERVVTLVDLKQALIDSPVVIGIPCFEEIFYVGPSGLVAYPEQPQYCYGGHAICVVGFDDASRLVKFKNSWSQYWGDHGYGYLPYQYVNDFLWDGWRARDLSVTKEMLKGAKIILER